MVLSESRDVSLNTCAGSSSDDTVLLRIGEMVMNDEFKEWPESVVVGREDLVVWDGTIAFHESEHFAFDVSPWTTAFPCEVQSELGLFLSILLEVADGAKRFCEERSQMCAREISWADVAEFAHRFDTAHSLGVVAGNYRIEQIASSRDVDGSVEGVQFVLVVQLREDCEERILDVADAGPFAREDADVESPELVDSGEVEFCNVSKGDLVVKEINVSIALHREMTISVAVRAGQKLLSTPDGKWP